MIHFFTFIFRFVGFVILICSIPTFLGAVFYGPRGALIGAGLALGVLFLDSLRVQSILKKSLKPTIVKLYGKKVYRIEDASSHLFVTQAPWMPARIWITRGAFSLLTQDDLHSLVVHARKVHPFFKLSFETYLTTLL